MSRLKEKYKSEVAPALMEQFNYRSSMQIPRLEKIVLNIGLGEAIQNPKALESATSELALISSQKAIVTKAKRSVSNFKLRAGMSIGAKVTLRGERMWSFLDKLMNVNLPRVRDFRGVSSRSFDGRGNYSLGVREQLIFPEIDYDKVEKIRGMDITIVTTAGTDLEAFELLKALGMPFRQG